MTWHDDGNFNWRYECIYVTPTNDPNDYCYEVGLETKEGGYMDGNEITCRYWKTKDDLTISRKGTKLHFFVQNFQDIEVIMTPMIKAHGAKPYPVFESQMSKIRKERKQKLNKIKKSTI